jgi:NAD(P)-dependent dehydrogenase (short-subunit alcohol dehydrogenase family)
MSTRFAGKAVLVTGGGAGIGRAVAHGFARAGAAVVVAGRSAQTLQDTEELIRTKGGTATAITADITRSADLAALIAQTIATHGSLDIAVNSAGILTGVGAVGDLDEQQWHDMIATNLTGTMLSMKHEIAHMRHAGGGVIVNIASTLGAHRRVAGLGAYSATKAAVIALTKTAALDHIGEGIRINAISPGPIDTPGSYRPGETRAERDARISHQLPLGRVGTLQEITDAVLYLASPQASFLVGTDLVIDGGSTA